MGGPVTPRFTTARREEPSPAETPDPPAHAQSELTAEKTSSSVQTRRSGKWDSDTTDTSKS